MTNPENSLRVQQRKTALLNRWVTKSSVRALNSNSLRSVLESVSRMEQLGNEMVHAAKSISISFPSGQRDCLRSGLAGEGEVSALWIKGKGSVEWVGRSSWVKSKAAVGVGRYNRTQNKSYELICLHYFAFWTEYAMNRDTRTMYTW